MIALASLRLHHLARDHLGEGQAVPIHGDGAAVRDLARDERLVQPITLPDKIPVATQRKGVTVPQSARLPAGLAELTGTIRVPVFPACPVFSSLTDVNRGIGRPG